MNNILKIKLLTIALISIFSSYFYFDEHFIENIEPLYRYSLGAVIVTALSLGIILSAGLYNLAFYFYIRNRQYLFYGLAQLSIIIFLVTLESIFIAPFDEIWQIKSTLLFNLSRASILLFSMLFIYEFLRVYSLDKVRSTVKVIIYLTLADIIFTLIFSFSIFSNFVPIFLTIWLVLSEANREVKKRDMPFYALMIGWYLVIAIAMIEYIGFVDMRNFSFPFIHIAFALESLLLSFAISYKFKILENQQRLQQSLLLQQSRLASMGEMISIIAHQWRQPLNVLSVIHMNLKRPQAEEKKELLLDEADRQITYMSETIEHFREFYNPSKQKEDFSVQRATQESIQILQHSFEREKIRVETQYKEDFNIYGNRNEFEQVVLNILNNAKDIFKERATTSPTITLKLEERSLTISDNGGGIPTKYLKKIFEPHFTTKPNNDGIGLYISKLIIEQELKGKLEVTTDLEGTTFWLRF